MQDNGLLAAAAGVDRTESVAGSGSVFRFRATVDRLRTIRLVTWLS
jgi:hypothetical protein